MERNVAKYPRIVVSNDLIELLYPGIIISKDLLLIKENDEILFVDFLSHGDPSTSKKYLNNIVENQKSLKPSIREKHRWLMDYFNFKFPSESNPVIPRFSTIT